MNWLKINGHHVYSFRRLFPGVYAYRVGLGPWRLALTKYATKAVCHAARDRVLAAAKGGAK